MGRAAMGRATTFRPVKHSLAGPLGPEYLDAVVAAQAKLTGQVGDEGVT